MRVRLELVSEGRAEIFDVAAADACGAVEADGPIRIVQIRGCRQRLRIAREADRVFVWCAGENFAFVIRPEAATRNRQSAQEPGVLAPMPGKILATLVREGDSVRKNAPLLVLEAMKMEHEIRAPHDGTISKLPYREGDRVEAGAALVEFAR